MIDLAREYLPHDPGKGLFVSPDIPVKRLNNAIGDYAKKVHPEEVVALYDATLLGSAKDGAVFTADRFVFQNNDLQPAHIVRYEDLVGVKLQKSFIGGRRLEVSVNRGRATLQLEIDFSGRKKAAPFVERFLEQAMHRTTELQLEQERPSVIAASKGSTDVEVVTETLEALVNEGVLSPADFSKLMRVLQ